MRRKGRGRGGESSKPVLKLRLCVYVSERERGDREKEIRETESKFKPRLCGR